MHIHINICLIKPKKNRFRHKKLKHKNILCKFIILLNHRDTYM